MCGTNACLAVRESVSLFAIAFRTACFLDDFDETTLPSSEMRTIPRSDLMHGQGHHPLPQRMGAASVDTGHAYCLKRCNGCQNFRNGQRAPSCSFTRW